MRPITLTAKSFVSIRKIWTNDLEKAGVSDSVIIFVGTKIDLDYRKRSQSEGKIFTKKNGMSYIEPSARTDENICNFFFMIVMNIKEILN